jgi:hypothetical protein
VTSISLARSYFSKCRKRLRALETLLAEEAFSDVIREAQELVELAAKGMLRFVGVEPPKLHDVGRLLVQHRDRLPAPVADAVERVAEISHRLRKEREFAFYGDEDFIPTEEYGLDDASAAFADARFVVSLLDAFPSTDEGA